MTVPEDIFGIPLELVETPEGAVLRPSTLPPEALLPEPVPTTGRASFPVSCLANQTPVERRRDNASSRALDAVDRIEQSLSAPSSPPGPDTDFAALLVENGHTAARLAALRPSYAPPPFPGEAVEDVDPDAVERIIH